MTAEKSSPDPAEQNADSDKIINFRDRVRKRLLEQHPERENTIVDFRPWNPPPEKPHPGPPKKVVKNSRIVFNNEKAPW